MSDDQYGLCRICGRRDEHCGKCHRGHDYAREHPQWAVSNFVVDGDRIIPSAEARSKSTPSSGGRGGA